MLMLTLGVVMLFNPARLTSLSKSLIVFAIAFGLVVGVLVLHRRILPAFGIWIGTEAGGHQEGAAPQPGAMSPAVAALTF